MSEPVAHWRSMPLTDILTKDQMARVEEIFTSALKNRASEQQLTQALRDYLGTLDRQLRDKGVLPDYLALVLIAKAKGVI